MSHFPIINIIRYTFRSLLIFLKSHNDKNGSNLSYLPINDWTENPFLFMLKYSYFPRKPFGIINSGERKINTATVERIFAIRKLN